MVNISFYTESRYKVNRKLIRSQVKKTLKEQKITSDVEISISIIGDRKMKDLNKKFRNINKTTDVLSFSQLENPFKFTSSSSTKTIYLGDVVVSYPQAVTQASQNNILVDDEINNLVAHGLLHLLGIHHH